MTKFPVRLPRSRLEKQPRSQEPGQSALSHEHIENFTKDLEIMQLSVAIQGGNPGDIRGHGEGFVNLSFDNFQPGMGGLDSFCTFLAPGGRPAEFVNIYKYL